MEDIQKLLSDFPEITDYALRERLTQSAEWFFVKDRLDQTRIKNVDYSTLRLFVDNPEDGTRGHAEITFYPSHTREECLRLIQDGIAGAKLIKNPAYTFPDEHELTVPAESAHQDPTVGFNLIRFLFETAAKEQGDLNSFEVFVNHHDLRVRTRRGLDLAYSNQDLYLEMIVNAKTDHQEIELYREFNFATLDHKTLGRQLGELFTAARDRALALPTPDLKRADLILSMDNVRELLSVYVEATSAASLYNKNSPLTVGEAIQKGPKGDRITLTLLDSLEGSVHNAPVDADGVILKSRQVITDSVFTTPWGDGRHAFYLGIEPTGALRNFEVRPGSKSDSELERGQALEVLDFSSFIVDPNSGDFSGEIRLGYFLDEGKRTPVSGGSISGNLYALHESLHFSEETVTLNGYRGPRKLRLEGVSVAGIR